MQTKTLGEVRVLKPCWEKRLAELERRRSVLEASCEAMPHDDDLWLDYEKAILDLNRAWSMAEFEVT